MKCDHNIPILPYFGCDGKTKAKDLKEGQEFKFNERQRKWRVVNKIVTISEDITLIIFDGCKQSEGHPDDELITRKN